eukprot:gene20269-27025_t
MPWKHLAKVAVMSLDEHYSEVDLDLIGMVGNCLLNALSFFRWRIEDFVYISEETHGSWQVDWRRPRFYDVQFAVTAVFCSHDHSDRVSTRNTIFANMVRLHLVTNSEEAMKLADGVSHDGMGNQDWEMIIRSTALRWLRVRAAARTIADCYRRRLERRRLKMIQSVLVPFFERNKNERCHPICGWYSVGQGSLQMEEPQQLVLPGLPSFGQGTQEMEDADEQYLKDIEGVTAKEAGPSVKNMVADIEKK